MTLSKEYWHGKDTSKEIKERQWIARISFRTSKISKSVNRKEEYKKNIADSLQINIKFLSYELINSELRGQESGRLERTPFPKEMASNIYPSPITIYKYKIKSE